MIVIHFCSLFTVILLSAFHSKMPRLGPILHILFGREFYNTCVGYCIICISIIYSCYRRLNKQRSVFPSSQALMKALYLGTFEIAKKWTMPIHPIFGITTHYIAQTISTSVQRFTASHTTTLVC